jgi:hypothetical protein
MDTILEPDDTPEELPEVTTGEESDNNIEHLEKEKPDEQLDVRFGRVTFISEEKGAFVELLTGDSQEFFVPRKVLEISERVTLDSMVQITKKGDEVVDIKFVK